MNPTGTPTYQQKLALLNANPSLPQTVDLNSIDPMLRDVYSGYNQQIGLLNTGLGNARNQATLAQQDVDKAYQVAAGNAQNAYKTNLDVNRQTNQDAQLSNRLRARATGGAPSSGFLDLANRTDNETQRANAQAGGQLSSSLGQADLAASQALSQIVNNLNDAILKIQADGTLSLRQRDDAVASARAQAARAAQDAMSWDDLLGGLTEEDDGGSVQGAATTNPNIAQQRVTPNQTNFKQMYASLIPSATGIRKQGPSLAIPGTKKMTNPYQFNPTGL